MTSSNEMSGSISVKNKYIYLFHCSLFLYHSGISSFITSSLVLFLSSALNVNRPSGKSCPFGSLVPGALSSSKKGRVRAPSGFGLRAGLYLRTLDISSIAKARSDDEDFPFLFWKTYSHALARICGNLNSE